MAESLDQLSDTEHALGEFGAFLDEIERTAFDETQRRVLSGMENGQDAWQYVLAWLTRDQECRIEGLTHWRHPESSSHSPVRKASVESRLNILRVALGLYSEDASALRMDIARGAHQAEAAKNKTLRLQAHFDALWEELATALGVDAESIWPPPEARLLQDEQSVHAEHRDLLIGLADKKIREVGVLSSRPVSIHDEAQLENVASQLARVKQGIGALENEIKQHRERVNLLEARSANDWSNVREAKSPRCPYDGALLDVERAKDVCPLPRLPDPVAARVIAEETDGARQQALADLARAEDELGSLRGTEASLAARASALQRTIELHYAAAIKQTEASQAAWATKGMVRQLFDLRARIDDAARVESQARDAVKLLQQRQVAALIQYPTAQIERWFDILIRRVVAFEAKGWVSLDGAGLHPRIDWRGTRRSVALKSLQVVLFDLAAILCSVEGHSPSPAFLLHDSPREGDLDPWTYSRIFEVMFDLGPDDNAAPFQYILTTTTDPPERVKSRVRLRLSADTPGGRLFCVDL